MEITAKMDSLRADEVICAIREDSGEEVRKTIMFSDFVKALQDIEGRFSRKVTRIGALPEGFVDGGIDGTTMECFIRVPAGKRPVHFLGTDIVVPFPELLFHFVSCNHKIGYTGVIVVSNGKSYAYPFGNVYPDAHICWGGNALPRVHSMKDFDSIVQMFFMAGTNNDLYTPPKVSRKGKEVCITQKDLLELVSKLDTFPDELLRPGCVTLEKFMG